MEEPTYHLAGVMHTRDELPADFDGPLSVILLLLSKNKIEIQDVSITSILEQYLAYLDEMKRLDMEIAQRIHRHGVPSHAHQNKDAALCRRARGGYERDGASYPLPRGKAACGGL